MICPHYVDPVLASQLTVDLKQTLRDAGLRATQGRMRVLQCLVDAERPVSHAEVCELIADYDRATLYRNLMDLTTAGLVERSDHGDHVWRFELKRDDAHDTTAHAHFVCQDCGDVSCLPDDVVAVKSTRGLPKSMKKQDVEIVVRGLCDTCN